MTEETSEVSLSAYSLAVAGVCHLQPSSESRFSWIDVDRKSIWLARQARNIGEGGTLFYIHLE